jgi:hypothetical protein
VASGSIIAARAHLAPTALKTMTVAFLLLASCLGQDRGGSAASYAFEISKILGREQRSGSLEYWGVCGRDFYPDLPKIQSASGKEISSVDEIRTMFAVDSVMQVTQERDGKVRMVETDVPDDLLNVRIHHVVLPGDVFGTTSARFAILKTPEVQNFRIEHNIGPMGEWGGGFSFEGPLSKPVAQVELNDVTVAEAFDKALEMYPGYWLYESCRDEDGARIAYFSFYRNAPHSFYASQEQQSSNSGLYSDRIALGIEDK